MEIIGHSAIEMTMNVYGHVMLDNQRAALNCSATRYTAKRIRNDARCCH